MGVLFNHAFVCLQNHECFIHLKGINLRSEQVYFKLILTEEQATDLCLILHRDANLKRGALVFLRRKIYFNTIRMQ